jgi:trimeric autotransporter adhesin
MGLQNNDKKNLSLIWWVLGCLTIISFWAAVDLTGKLLKAGRQKNHPPVPIAQIERRSVIIENGRSTETLPISTEGLAVYYAFNGNARDSSANSNDAVVSGATLTKDRFGRANSAYYFDGKKSVIYKDSPIGLPQGNAARTLSFWFSSDDDKQYTAALAGYGTADYGKNFQVCVGPLYSSDYPVVWRLNGYGNSYDWRTAARIQDLFDGKWHHCAVTYDGQVARIFFDGVLKSQTNDFTYNTDPQRIVIGAEIAKQGWNYKGAIDSVLIFKRVLSDREIALLFHDVGYP